MRLTKEQLTEEIAWYRAHENAATGKISVSAEVILDLADRVDAAVAECKAIIQSCENDSGKYGHGMEDAAEHILAKLEGE